MEKGTKVNKKISKTAKSLKNDFEKLANLNKAKILSGFFKTGKGEYGEGDVFIGLTVPIIRTAIKPFLTMPFEEISKLLHSKVHEHRFAALQILVTRYKKAQKANDSISKREIFKFYIANKKQVNNWDLVDSSAEHILGNYLFDKNKDILEKFAKNKNLWVRRIAMLSCFNFIKNNEFKFAIKIAKILLHDNHDLMHKAVGWMLREIGKRDKKVLTSFLNENYNQMPRTMLRYSIEKFTKSERELYLKGEVQ